MKNNKWLKMIWKTYSIAGVVWLTVSIVSMASMHFINIQSEHYISGSIKEIIKTDWNGFKNLHAIVETKDGKGNVMVPLYQASLEVGEEVNLEISTGGASNSFIYSTIIK